MKARDRVLAAIDRTGILDRVPIDMGGFQSGVCWKAYEGLKKELGVQSETKILERNQMLAVLDEEVLQRLHVDTRYVFAAPGTPPKWLDAETYQDEWGMCWRKPASSEYFNMLTHPWSDLTDDEIQEVTLPPLNSQVRCSGLRERAQAIRQNGEYALFTSLSSIFEQSWFLVGLERFFMALADDHVLIETVLDKVLEQYLAVNDAIYAEIGDYIDCVQFYGDVGTQTGPLVRPDVWRKLIKPRERQLIEQAKRKTGARIAWHSCGSCRQFIPDFIEMGVDILNPVQTRAFNMDPFELAREFGNDISFWGGIDGQKVLPLGTVQDVKDEVRRMIDALDGNYLIGSCHNIQNDVPACNIRALFDEAVEYGQKDSGYAAG